MCTDSEDYVGRGLENGPGVRDQAGPEVRDRAGLETGPWARDRAMD